MELYYRVEAGELTRANEAEANFIVIRDNSKQAHQQFINEYELPKDIFDWTHLPFIAPRYEKINYTTFGETIVLVLTNIDVETRQDNVEGRLESVTFLLGKDKLTCFIDEDSTFDRQVFKMYSGHIKNLQSIIIYGGILLYKNFAKELSCQKELIDDLDQAARQSSIGSELEELADVERDMVFLEHVLDTQRDTFDHLFDNKSFVEKLNNNQLIYDIRLYNRQVNKLVHVYRDLLETVGDLFSDIMSNRLNALMKVLNSLAIIISIPALVGSMWGINTQGLPFMDHPQGSLIVFILALIATILTAIYLKHKDLF